MIKNYLIQVLTRWKLKKPLLEMARWFSFLRGHPNLSTLLDLKVISQISTEALAGRLDVCVLEIGSWMGCSTIPLAQISKDRGGILYCCDTWAGASETANHWIALYRDVFGAFWRRISRAKLQSVVVPLRGTSREVLPVLASATFDFIYIDGDHSYDGVQFDIKQAKRLIRPGGMIAGHDYSEGARGVMRAVDEAFGKPNCEGSVWWTLSDAE